MKRILIIIFSLTIFLTLISSLSLYLEKNDKGNVITDVLSNFISTKVDTYKEFNKLVKDIDKKYGTYSLYIKDLETSQVYEYNTNQQYYAASLFKLPVGVAVLKQIDLDNLILDTEFTYNSYHYTDGTGIIQNSDVGTTYTVNELLNNLFKHSDNIAQNILLEYLDVNSSDVYSVFPNGGNTSYYHTNESNAKEIGEYLEYIYTNDLLSINSKRYLLNTMTNTSFDDWLANKLDNPYAHKIGSWGSSWHDCGYVLNEVAEPKVIVCIMTQDTNFSTFLDVNTKLSSFIDLLLK